MFPRLFNATTLRIVGILSSDGTFTPGLTRYTYDGYFNDNLNFFSVTSAVSSVVTSQINITNARNLRSEQMIGFFNPSTTGTTMFSVTSDDACYVWIGNAAYAPTTQNALLKCPGIHNVNTTNARASAEVLLDSSLYYPIRIYYGNNTVAGSFTMTVKMPTLPLTYNVASNMYNDTTIFNV